MFTLRDVGGIGTRGDGGATVRTAGCGGTMIGNAGLAMALSIFLERSVMACCWASPNWENGAAGAGLVRASVRARASTMAASTEDVLGTGHWALVWKYLHCLGGVLRSGLRNIETVSAIVFWGGP